jgi:hypothetical protein
VPGERLPGLRTHSLKAMNTAQLLLSKNAQTQQRVSLTPWIVGGVVVIIALIIISRIRK